MKEDYMERQYIIENDRERNRLRSLVGRLTDEQLGMGLYKGWTVAVALAHLAFWDERRLVLVRKWKREGVKPSPIDENVINDTLVPILSAIPMRKAAELAVRAAEALDRELEEAPPELVASMEATGDRHALNRAIHRKMHLDEIEKLLKTAR
jgi:hypothetical protein